VGDDVEEAQELAVEAPAGGVLFDCWWAFKKFRSIRSTNKFLCDKSVSNPFHGGDVSKKISGAFEPDPRCTFQPFSL
jgi:hypothetical protein